MIINSNFEVVVYERNFVLKKYIAPVEKFKTIDGNKVSQGMSKGGWEIQGYFPSLAACLRGYVNVELRSVPMEVSEILRKLDEIMVVIENIKEEQGND